MPTPRHAVRPAVEPIMFQIGDKDVPFALTFNDFCDMEARYDASLSEIARDLGGNASAGKVRYLVALGLSDKDEVYSEDEAGQAIAQHGMLRFLEAIAVFINYAIGESVDLIKAAPLAQAAKGQRGK